MHTANCSEARTALGWAACTKLTIAGLKLQQEELHAAIDGESDPYWADAVRLSSLNVEIDASASTP